MSIKILFYHLKRGKLSFIGRPIWNISPILTVSAIPPQLSS